MNQTMPMLFLPVSHIQVAVQASRRGYHNEGSQTLRSFVLHNLIGLLRLHAPVSETFLKWRCCRYCFLDYGKNGPVE